MDFFDSVFIECPSCGSDVEFQTKAGECDLLEYREGDDVPAAIAVSINATAETCCVCGRRVVARAYLAPTKYMVRGV